MHAIIRMVLQGWRWVNQRRHVAAQGLTEYGLILVLIAMVAVMALTAVGESNRNRLHDVSCKVGAATDTPPADCP